MTSQCSQAAKKDFHEAAPINWPWYIARPEIRSRRKRCTRATGHWSADWLSVLRYKWGARSGGIGNLYLFNLAFDRQQQILTMAFELVIIC